MAKKRKKANGISRQRRAASTGSGQARQAGPPQNNTRQQPAKPQNRNVPAQDCFDNLPARKPPAAMQWQEEEKRRAQQQNRQKQQAGKKKPGKKHNALPVEKPAQPVPGKEKKKRRPISAAKRRRNRRIAAIAFVAVLIVVGAVISMNVLFKIEKFEIEGETTYTQQELETAFGHEAGESLFSFNAKQSEAAIEKSLPYIENVTIRRRLPNTIVFRVEPAAERYYAALSNGQVVVMSTSRKVLRITDAIPEGLSFIHGVEEATAVPGTLLALADEEKAATLNELLAVLDNAGVEGVNWVDVASPGSLSFRWQGRFTIVLGTKINMQQKLEYAMLLLTDTEQSEFTETDSGTLDVSTYPPEAHYRPGGGEMW